MPLFSKSRNIFSDAAQEASPLTLAWSFGMLWVLVGFCEFYFCIAIVLGEQVSGGEKGSRFLT
jgi:hypothetical protein